jgi:hypothetical protein
VGQKKRGFLKTTKVGKGYYNLFHFLLF